jgi:hypothetical protein
MVEGILECVIQHCGATVEKGLHGRLFQRICCFLFVATIHPLPVSLNLATPRQHLDFECSHRIPAARPEVDLS